MRVVVPTPGRNPSVNEFMRFSLRHDWWVRDQREHSIEVARTNGRREERLAAHFEPNGALREGYFSQWPHMGRGDVPAAPLHFERVGTNVRLAEILRLPLRQCY